MRRFLNYVILMTLLVGSLLSSCQKESVEVIDENDQDAQTISTELVGLLMMTTSNGGGIDDFIMPGNCFTIEFPFTLVIDGQEIVVESEDDYAEVIILIEETGANIDDVEIVFPITLILYDYSEIVVHNLSELEQVLIQCQAVDNGVTCVDFVYPVTIYLYNENTENTETIVVNSDEEMYLLLANLTEGDHISFQYPISVILVDGTVVQINDNNELEMVLSECDDTLNEDLIGSFLDAGTWYVGYFFKGENHTTYYCEFELNFGEEHVVTASSDGGVTTYFGEWEVDFSDDAFYLELNFYDFPFDACSGEWMIFEANMDIIVSHKDGIYDSVDVLIFSRQISPDC